MENFSCFRVQSFYHGTDPKHFQKIYARKGVELPDQTLMEKFRFLIEEKVILTLKISNNY